MNMHYETAHEPSHKSNVKQNSNLADEIKSGYFNCNVCDFKTFNESDLKRHERDKHEVKSKSMSPKQKKRKHLARDIIEQMEVDDSPCIDVEMEDIEEQNILSIRSKMQDDRIKRKELKHMEEEEKMKKKLDADMKKKKEEELKRNNETVDEKKRKRQISVQKKNMKKKARKEKNKDSQVIFEVDGKQYILKPIDDRFDKLFEEVGLVRKDHTIYKARADGGCGSNCAALHCHQDEQLGQYVRLNTNSYLVKFWPFFQPYFTFPHTQRVGTEIEPFKDEAEYLNFLKNNPKAKLLWMDHYYLQAVANMYQINVH